MSWARPGALDSQETVKGMTQKASKEGMPVLRLLRVMVAARLFRSVVTLRKAQALQAVSDVQAMELLSRLQ